MSTQIKMSVSRRIYQACQLDALAGHYGLTSIPPQGKGCWFAGPESAWRRLAEDVDFRSSGGWDQSGLYLSEGLHGRITKAAAKAT